MARPRRTIHVDLADPPPFDGMVDDQVMAEMVWVRATELLLIAQARLAERTPEHSHHVADSLDRDLRPDHRATTKPWPE